MARSRQSTNAVSLFPFLAVLVCAMGVLILLLIVTTRQIRSDSIAKAMAVRQERQGIDEPAEPPNTPELIDLEPAAPRTIRTEQPIESAMQNRPRTSPGDDPIEPSFAPDWGPPPSPPPIPHDPNEPIRSQIARLSSDKTQLSGAVHQQQQRTQFTRTQLGQLIAQQKRLQAEIDRLESETDRLDQSRQFIEQNQSDLIERNDQLRREIQQLKQVNSNRASRFAFVPFDGSSGTTRRPILIEFSHLGVRFLPEDVTLTSADLSGFTQQINPLREGVGALAAYWRARNRVEDLPDEQIEPYVLFIIRPSGVRYYAATRLIKGEGVDFGYELIEENAPLDLEEPDPRAVEALEEAIAGTMTRRDELLARFGLDDAIDNRGLKFRADGRGFEEDDGGARPQHKELTDFESWPEEGAAGSASSDSTTPRDRALEPINRIRPEPTPTPRIIERQEGDRWRTTNAPSIDGLPRPVDNSTPNRSEPNLPRFGQSVGPTAASRIRWGLSDPRATIGFERDLQIIVTAEKLKIGDAEYSLKKGPYDPELPLWAYQSIDEAVRQWGKPPASFYWIPAVKFRVYPGGNAALHHLERIVSAWGLDTKAENELNAPPERMWIDVIGQRGIDR